MLSAAWCANGSASTSSTLFKKQGRGELRFIQVRVYIYPTANF
jgi:hypothetical protein